MGLDFSDISKIEGIIRHHRHGSGSLISILQDIQSEYNYLSKEMLVLICERLGIPLSQAYSVTTFYHSFSLKPRGKHKLSVCLGTACHVRGGERIAQKISRALDIQQGETTEDLRFTLENVRCIGCCSLAPVITVDEDTFGHLTQDKIDKILEKYH
jgi:NADH:ubiquinone oxidoreductase subunit E